MVFFPLHAPILEPDLDLALGQAERVGNLHPPASRQVAIVVKLLLQFQDLLASVGGPGALGLPAGVIGVYRAHVNFAHPGVDDGLFARGVGRAGMQGVLGAGRRRGTAADHLAALPGLREEGPGC